MDGPNVNKKFYEDFSRKFGDENYQKLIHIGSYSLHIVDGAFRAGDEQSEWELKKFLKGAFTVFTILQLVEKTMKVLLALPPIL